MVKLCCIDGTGKDYDIGFVVFAGLWYCDSNPLATHVSSEQAASHNRHVCSQT